MIVGARPKLPRKGKTASTGVPRARARRIKHVPGRMNKLERRYAAHLDAQILAGEIATWEFEPLRLRLAEKTTYTPDFMVILPDGLIEFRETKGFWEEDARVKIKVAAELHPWFRFVAVTHNKPEHRWDLETFAIADTEADAAATHEDDLPSIARSQPAEPGGDDDHGDGQPAALPRRRPKRSKDAAQRSAPGPFPPDVHAGPHTPVAGPAQ